MAKPTRHTQPRRLILKTIKLAVDGLTAEQVLTRVRRERQPIGRATVYRNLDWLCRRGGIWQMPDQRGQRRYYGHTETVSHFTCQRCGRRVPVNRARIGSAAPGAMIINLIINGLCATCAASSSR